MLVQIGVNATAAGVLVTDAPDRSDATTNNYTINAKSGLGMRVVDGKKVPESLIVSWYNHGIRVLSALRRGHEARVRRATAACARCRTPTRASRC